MTRPGTRWDGLLPTLKTSGALQPAVHIQDSDVPPSGCCTTAPEPFAAPARTRAAAVCATDPRWESYRSALVPAAPAWTTDYAAQDRKSTRLNSSHLGISY